MYTMLTRDSSKKFKKTAKMTRRAKKNWRLCVELLILWPKTESLEGLAVVSEKRKPISSTLGSKSLPK